MASLRALPPVLLLLVSIALLLACPASAAGSDGTAGRRLLTGPRKGAFVLALFGDSFTDQGNTFAAAAVPQADLYFQGRYSNGPIWIDYLMASMPAKVQVKVFNYAYGGATACTANGLSAQLPFIRDLQLQTADFLSQYAACHIPKDRKLVPINFIGSNDLRGFLGTDGSNPETPTAANVAALVSSITSCRLDWAVAVANATGAKDLVLLPLLPVELAPEVPISIKPLAGLLVQAINLALQAAAALLQVQFATAPPGSPLAGVRLHVLPSFSTELLLTAVQPPFENILEPCFVHPKDALVIVPNLTACANPNAFASYDSLHPSTRVHQALGLFGILPALQQLGLLTEGGAN